MAANCVSVVACRAPNTQHTHTQRAPQYELEAGVAIGIVLCLLYFAFTYARVNMTVGGACFSGLPCLGLLA